MWRTVELSDVHNVVLILQDCGFVVVDVEVVWRAEDRHDTWESSRSGLPIHAIAGVLGLVSTNDRKQIILLQETARSGVREEVRTSSYVVVNEELLRLLLAEFFERICPENIAHKAVGWRFTEAVDRLDVFKGM